MVNEILKIVFNTIALVLAVLAIIFAYIGLPGTLDTEPLLAIAIIFLALAGFIRR